MLWRESCEAPLHGCGEPQQPTRQHQQSHGVRRHTGESREVATKLQKVTANDFAMCVLFSCWYSLWKPRVASTPGGGKAAEEGKGKREKGKHVLSCTTLHPVATPRADFLSEAFQLRENSLSCCKPRNEYTDALLATKVWHIDSTA